MNKPLVSVVTPTYRRPHYLREALESIVSQSYENLQIIVRDNASDDETPEVVGSFKDSRIEFLRAERTGTAWENGAECMRRVRGKYLFPLCDDDAAGRTYVETLVRFLEEDPRILAAYGATQVIDERGRTVGEYTPKGTCKWNALQVIEAWCGGALPLVSGINYVVPLSFVRLLGERHHFVHGHNSDNAIFMAAGIRGYVLFTDECVFSYRKHGQNSVESFRFEERMEGDRDFLAFLDDEVKAPTNASVPQEDWPRLRQNLQGLLAGSYYNRIRRHHLGKDGIVQNIRATTFAPASVYGLRQSLRQSYREDATVFHHLVRLIRGAKGEM